jgi:hypothetical protein
MIRRPIEGVGEAGEPLPRRVQHLRTAKRMTVANRGKR